MIEYYRNNCLVGRYNCDQFERVAGSGILIRRIIVPVFGESYDVAVHDTFKETGPPTVTVVVEADCKVWIAKFPRSDAPENSATIIMGILLYESVENIIMDMGFYEMAVPDDNCDTPLVIDSK
jgi:hypothetical protein